MKINKNVTREKCRNRVKRHSGAQNAVQHVPCTVCTLSLRRLAVDVTNAVPGVDVDSTTRNHSPAASDYNEMKSSANRLLWHVLRPDHVAVCL